MTVVTRPITMHDIKAAQRGWNMVAMSIADLKELVEVSKITDDFAGRVVSMAAQQIIAVKRRNGAEE